MEAILHDWLVMDAGRLALRQSDWATAATGCRERKSTKESN